MSDFKVDLDILTKVRSITNSINGYTGVDLKDIDNAIVLFTDKVLEKLEDGENIDLGKGLGVVEMIRYPNTSHLAKNEVLYTITFDAPAFNDGLLRFELSSTIKSKMFKKSDEELKKYKYVYK